jgi:CheY-like chemotaxis protein
MPRILMVDDEPGRIQYFRYALEDEHYAVDVIPDVAEAITYLETPPPDLIAVILDVQMPPGPFADQDQQGLATGKFLLKYIYEMHYIQQESRHPLPIAVLTQVTDSNILKSLEETQIYNRPKEKFMIWAKLDLDPDDFVGQFETWIEALAQLYK